MVSVQSSELPTEWLDAEKRRMSIVIRAQRSVLRWTRMKLRLTSFSPPSTGLPPHIVADRRRQSV